MASKKELSITISAAIAAGKAIMEVYALSDLGVEHKADDSPLTLADKRAHAVIERHLTPTGIPILSEEGKHLPYNERRQWERFWLVDPLDGTKEFIKRNGEFTVNIALVENGKPVLGVIYVPVQERLYVGVTEPSSREAWRIDNIVAAVSFANIKENGQKLPCMPLPGTYTVVGSRSHMNSATGQYFEKLQEQHGKVQVVARGSSLKMCLVAEGKAHEYPRLGPTMEWDTAAGHAIAEAAGKKVVLHNNPEKPLQYNKEDLTNPWFLVY